MYEEILLELEDEKKEFLEGAIERENLDKYRSFLRSNRAIAIAGIRRCGKSVLAHMLLKGKEYYYVNFDHELLYGLKTEDLSKIYKELRELFGERRFFLLDEIQNIEGWELFVNRLLRKRYKVVITGSNSRLLSTELSTHLTGRKTTIFLFPFSFREFLRYHNFPIKKVYSESEVGDLYKFLREYILNGGMPESFKEEDKKRYYRELYDDILKKDILARYKIRERETFLEISNFVMSSFSSRISFRRISDIFGLGSVHTAKNYVRYLEEAFLIFLLENYSPKISDRIKSPKKVYPIDTGFSNYLSFKVKDKFSRLLENLVSVELRRISLLKSYDLYYFDVNGEVDFVLKKNHTVRAVIQVTYSEDLEDIKEREYNSLKKAIRILKPEKFFIVSWKSEGEMKGIKVIPLWKFLLFSEEYV